MTIALDTAISGLRAAQRALDTISANISNAGTEGYSRKILPQETLLVGGQAVGVRLQAVVRNVDMTLLKDLVRQISVKNSAQTRESYLSRIQDFHGPAEAERSLSAQVGKLADAFSEMSVSPDSDIQLAKVLTSAQETASTFNRFTRLLDDLRNQAQAEIASAVTEVNRALTSIASLNQRIAVLDSRGDSTAEFEDQRDIEIRKVSEYLEISSFQAENKRIVLMTRQGQTLADDLPYELTFDNTPLLSGSYYPGNGANGVLLNGIDITTTNLNGRLGALITMRDQTLPTYQAQADELAQKMAERFNNLGLKLFTDSNNLVPSSSAPPAVVSYVGFAGDMRVNRDIVADPSLLRSGTYGQTALPGSNEMIRKISQFAFGLNYGQTATGNVDISAGTIFASTGLTPTAQAIGNIDITDYVPDLGSAPNITLPANFTLSIGATPYAITINPGDTATDLVNTINTAVGSTVADLNGVGQLRITADDTITLADAGIGAAGMADLGFTFGATPAVNPSFTVQVGTQSPVTINISAATTAASMMTSLNTIPGLNASLDVNGYLVLYPTQGGDITLKNTNGQPIQALGLTITAIPHGAFRSSNLGPAATLSTGLVGNATLEEFSRGVITSHSEDHNSTELLLDKETAFYETLNKRNNDTSGVDIDRELAELIRIQTAYSAAARMISASERMMDELLAAFRA